MSNRDVDRQGVHFLPSPQLVRRFLGVFGVDALVRASGLLLLPVYLRFMGQAEFGVYAYLNAVAAALALILGFGLYAAHGKLYYDHAEHERPAVLFTVNLLLVGMLGSTLLAVCLSGLDVGLLDALLSDQSDAAAYRWPVIAGVLSSVLSLHLLSYLYLRERLGTARLYNVARVVLMNAVALGALWGWEGDEAARRLAFAYSTELAITAVFFVRCLPDFRCRVLPDVARRALAIGTPITISGAVGVLANLSDRYFIERLGTREDLSVYALALTLASVVPLVFGSFQNLWLPGILRQGSTSASKALTARAILPIGVALIVLSVVVVAGVALLLALGVLEADYRRALGILPVVLASAIVAAVAAMYTNLILKAGRLGIIVPVGVLAAGTGIVLNVLLVPRHGVAGAAVSSLVVNAVFLACYHRFCAGVTGEKSP